MSEPPIGFVGLGNMGSALAANLLKAGHAVLAYDMAGPQRTPDGAATASSIDELRSHVDVVVFSLPDSKAVLDVARQLIRPAERRARLVVDTSTIGVRGAHLAAGLLASGHLRYVDAPVSGGVAGARARTLTVMCAGQDDAVANAGPVLAALSDRVLRIPGPPGSAQALKLANNFLSATALAATSEAIAFGLSAGIDMKTMLDVLNVSSGRSAATMDKFPEHVLTARYASGFTNSLMAKDLRLYLDAATENGDPTRIGALVTGLWEDFAGSAPGADFTRIFPFIDGE